MTLDALKTYIKSSTQNPTLGFYNKKVINSYAKEQMVAKAIKERKDLTSIQFTKCKFTEAGIKEIFVALEVHSKSLNRLSFKNCSASGNAKLLILLLQNPTLPIAVKIKKINICIKEQAALNISASLTKLEDGDDTQIDALITNITTSHQHTQKTAKAIHKLISNTQERFDAEQTHYKQEITKFEQQRNQTTVTVNKYITHKQHILQQVKEAHKKFEKTSCGLLKQFKDNKSNAERFDTHLIQAKRSNGNLEHAQTLDEMDSKAFVSKITIEYLARQQEAQDLLDNKIQTLNKDKLNNESNIIATNKLLKSVQVALNSLKVKIQESQKEFNSTISIYKEQLNQIKIITTSMLAQLQDLTSDIPSSPSEENPQNLIVADPENANITPEITTSGDDNSETTLASWSDWIPTWPLGN